MLKRFCDNCNREIPEEYGTLRNGEGVDLKRNLIKVEISSYQNRNTELIPIEQGPGGRITILLICRRCAGKIFSGMAARISKAYFSNRREINALVHEYLEDEDVLSEEEQEKKDSPAGRDDA